MRVVIVCLLASCAWTPTGVVHNDTDTIPKAPKITPAIRVVVHDPAVRFGLRPRAVTPIARAGLDAMRAFAADRGVIAGDSRLDRAAEDLANAGTVSDAATTFVLRGNGVIESASRVWVARDVETLARQFDDALFVRNARVGIGASRDGKSVVAVVVHGAGVSVDFPRTMSGIAKLVGTLADRFHAPEVTVTHADGSIVRPELEIDGQQFRSTISCSDGELWIDIAARDGDGSHPLAAFPVACGETLPSILVHTPPETFAGLADPTSHIVAALDYERSHRGLSILRSDPRLAAAARSHAEQVARHAPEESFGERLREVGLDPPSVVESVVIADDLASAVDALMNNPSYHAAFATTMTHAGVGIATAADGKVTLVLEAARVVPRIDTHKVATKFVDDLRAEAARRGSQIGTDPDAMMIAGEFARGLAVGWSRKTLRPLHLMELATFYGGEYEVVTIGFYDPSELDPRRLLLPGTHTVGVGIAQSARDGYFAGKCFAVMVLEH